MGTVATRKCEPEDYAPIVPQLQKSVEVSSLKLGPAQDVGGAGEEIHEKFVAFFDEFAPRFGDDRT